MNTKASPLNTVRAAIVGWEKLRIPFNLLLLGVGLLLSWDLYSAFGGIHVYVFWAIIYGITVNVFFCLGPLAEIYLLTLIPARLQLPRMLVFVVGTVFSLMVTAILAARMCLVMRGVAHGV